MSTSSGGEVAPLVTVEEKEYDVEGNGASSPPLPSSPSASFFQTLDLNTLAHTVAISDRTLTVRQQVMPIVTSFLSITSAAKHGKLVLEILEPFVSDLFTHVDNAQKMLQSRIPQVDQVFQRFVDVCPVDIKELGWPEKPLEAQLVPALVERSPVGEITGFRAQLVSFRATVDKLHQGDLIGIATDALRGDLHLDEFRTQLAKIFDLLALVQKAFDFFWGIIKKIGDAVLQLFDKVKVYAQRFTAAALLALQEFQKLASAAAEVLSNAIVTAEKFFSDTVGKAAEILANTVAGLKANLEAQLNKLKEILASSLAEVERVYLMAKNKAEAVFNEAVTRVEDFYNSSVKSAESLATTAISEARALRDRVTSEPKRRLVDGRNKIEQLNAQIASVAEKAKGSMLESIMLEGSAMLQREVNEITEKVCSPMEATIVSAEKQCDEVLSRAVQCKEETLATAEAEKNRGLQTVREEYAKSMQSIEQTKVESASECTRSFEEATRSVQTQFDVGTRDAEDVHARTLAAAESVKQAAKEEAEKMHAQTIAAASAVKDETDAKAKSVFVIIDTEMQKAQTQVEESVKNPATTLSAHSDNMFVVILSKLEAAKLEAEKSSSMDLVEAVKSGGCCGFLFSCFSNPSTPASPPESQPLVIKT